MKLIYHLPFISFISIKLNYINILKFKASTVLKLSSWILNTKGASDLDERSKAYKYVYFPKASFLKNSTEGYHW